MARQKWEYLNYLGAGSGGPVEETETRAGGVLYRTEDVDELGEQGWELIGVDNSGRRPHYYFRRPKNQEPAEAAAAAAPASLSDPDPPANPTPAEPDPGRRAPVADRDGWRTTVKGPALAARE